MQDQFIQTQNDKIIIDQGQLVTYAALAAVIVVVLIILLVLFKKRKKNFIKTMPTNLKSGE